MRLTGKFASLALLALALTAPSTGTSAQPAPSQAWQKEWSDTIARAKGQDLALAVYPDPVNVAVVQVFKAKFPGINVQMNQLSTTRFSPRVIAEQKGGVYAWDAFIGPTGNLNTAVVPFGGFEKITNFFILPEVKDPAKWRAPDLRFSTHKGEFVFLYSLTLSNAMYANTRMLGGLKITKPDDLLNPALKGKIAIRDPGTPTAGANHLSAMMKLKGADGEQFVRRLLTEMQTTIMDNPRQITTAVIRGDKALIIGGEPTSMAQCRNEKGCGAVVDINVGIDMLLPHGLAVLKNAPHRDATKVWVNWFLSKEGQEALVRAASREDPNTAISQRVDVAPHPSLAKSIPDYTHLEKLFISTEDERYIRAVNGLYTEIKTRRR